jgi:Raf kinase inhibitor-like YbhB/YbcL family protein
MLLLMGCRHEKRNASGVPIGGMTITSPAITDGGDLPVKYTCSGKNISPQLAFDNIPSNATRLELELTDPDAPGGTFTHWVVRNIPPTTTGVSEGMVPIGGVEVKNSYGNSSYGPPCPPPGDRHRYVFTLTAYDATGKVIARSMLWSQFRR